MAVMRLLMKSVFLPLGHYLNENHEKIAPSRADQVGFYNGRRCPT